MRVASKITALLVGPAVAAAVDIAERRPLHHQELDARH